MAFDLVVAGETEFSVEMAGDSGVIGHWGRRNVIWGVTLAEGSKKPFGFQEEQRTEQFDKPRSPFLPNNSVGPLMDQMGGPAFSSRLTLIADTDPEHLPRALLRWYYVPVVTQHRDSDKMACP
jgi:hypothetical protein